MNAIRNIVNNFYLFVIKIINEMVSKDSNRLIFYSYVDFSDNSRALYEKLKESKNFNALKIVWIVKDTNREYNACSNTEFVKHKSVKSMLRFVKSKYIFRTHSLFGGIYSKRKQVMCLVFHGMPFKKTGLLNGEKIKKNNYDYLNITSPLFQKIMSDSMGSTLECNVISGLPRNDDLFSPNDILKDMGFPRFKKVIIWMPTFRKSFSGISNGKESSTGIPTIKEIDDFKIINEFLVNWDMALILKLHPWAINRLGDCIDYSNIFVIKDSDIPTRYSLYNLIGATDALLTDFSSVFIDYLIIDKPIGFVFDDINEYEIDRGFNFYPVENYLPGAKITNINQLFSFLSDTANEIDGYRDCRQKVSELFHTYRDAKSSERFLEHIGLFP